MVLLYLRRWTGVVGVALLYYSQTLLQLLRLDRTQYVYHQILLTELKVAFV